MKVTFRLNNRVANDCFGKRGTAEDWVQNLSKYLSDDALVELSVFTHKVNNDASLLVRDNGMNIHATSTKETMEDAIDSVVYKCAKQLVKRKDKRISKSSMLNHEEFGENILDGMDDSVISTKEYQLYEAEKALAAKKKTPRYKRTVDRYVTYLYRDKEIENAENHLRILYSILDTEKDTILHKDYLLLTQSILQIEQDINTLIEKKKNYESYVRDQEYIEETIEEELNVLNLRRMYK